MWLQKPGFGSLHVESLGKHRVVQVHCKQPLRNVLNYYTLCCVISTCDYCLLDIQNCISQLCSSQLSPTI